MENERFVKKNVHSHRLVVKSPPEWPDLDNVHVIWLVSLCSRSRFQKENPQRGFVWDLTA